MEFPVNVSSTDIVEAMRVETEYEDIIDFILEIDDRVGDSVFTEMLYEAIKRRL